MSTAPKHKRRAKKERTALVEVIKLEQKDQIVKLKATGTVIPARSLKLNARVSGHVISINPLFEPGSRVAAGTVLLTLDKDDFKLAVTRSEVALAKAQELLRQAGADLITAEYQYKLELGQQDIAAYEWERIEDKSVASELDKELTLRKPHLKNALAKIEVAKSKVKTAKVGIADAEALLRLAKLNLERTEIKAPFDAVISTRTVNVGMVVSSQTSLGELIGTDESWVEVSLPVNSLQWVAIPDKKQRGSFAHVSLSGNNGSDISWNGEVIGLRPALEENGRRARVLVSVKEPFAGDNPLLLGSFVNVSIEGKVLNNIFPIPRKAIHEGSVIWLVDEDSRIEFRSVRPLWSDKNTVYITDKVMPGDKLITTDIASIVPKMKVQIAGEPKKSHTMRKGGNISGKNRDGALEKRGDRHE